MGIEAPSYVPLLTPRDGTTPLLDKLPPRPSQFPPSNPFSFPENYNGSPWKVTRHVFPAAFPRSVVGAVKKRKEEFNVDSKRPPDPITVSDKTLSIKEQLKILVKLQATAGLVKIDDPTTFENDEQLWIVANRYVPKDPAPSGVTIFCTPATGFPKENLEPFFRNLLLDKNSTHAPINEIWVFDDVSAGDSALLNRECLGSTTDLIDSGRDIAQFILRYLPPLGANSEEDPPTLLERQEDFKIIPNLERFEHSHQKSTDNSFTTNEFFKLPNGLLPWRGRLAIYGIGYSHGSVKLIHTAGCLPGLLNGLHIIEPTLVPPLWTQYLVPMATEYSMATLARQMTFKSREEAKDVFLTSRLSTQWHPEMIERYVQFGLISKEGDRKTFILKSLNVDECKHYFETPLRSQRTAFTILQNVRGTPILSMTLAHVNSVLPRWATRTIYENIPLLIILDSLDNLNRQEYPDNLAIHDRKTVLMSSHLCIHENPERVAREVNNYLNCIFPKTSWSTYLRDLSTTVKSQYLARMVQSKI